VSNLQSGSRRSPPVFKSESRKDGHVQHGGNHTQVIAINALTINVALDSHQTRTSTLLPPVNHYSGKGIWYPWRSLVGKPYIDQRLEQSTGQQGGGEDLQLVMHLSITDQAILSHVRLIN